MSRIRTSHAYGETPRNVFDDFDWLHYNRERLFNELGEVFVVVYKQEVIGAAFTGS